MIDRARIHFVFQTNSLKKLQVFFSSRTLFLQVHTNLNSIKFFASSRYKPPTCTYTQSILLNSKLYMRTPAIVNMYACSFFIVQGSKVWRHQFANVSFRTFKPHHTIYTVAETTCAKCQTSSINESEDREVWSFTQPHTNLSYLVYVPNFRNKH